MLGLVVLALLLLSMAPLALPDSYDWVSMGTSESAAQGVQGAWVARTGFVILGLAVLGAVALCRRRWGPIPALLHGCFGLGLVLVAVFSHAPWEPGATVDLTEDRLHSVAASVVGFSFVAGVALTAALRPRAHRTRRRLVADGAALAVTGTVPLLMDSTVWGVLQRLMFLTAAAWFAGELVSDAQERAARAAARGAP